MDSKRPLSAIFLGNGERTPGSLSQLQTSNSRVDRGSGLPSPPATNSTASTGKESLPKRVRKTSIAFATVKSMLTGERVRKPRHDDDDEVIEDEDHTAMFSGATASNSSDGNGSVILDRSTSIGARSTSSGGNERVKSLADRNRMVLDKLSSISSAASSRIHSPAPNDRVPLTASTLRSRAVSPAPPTNNTLFPPKSSGSNAGSSPRGSYASLTSPNARYARDLEPDPPSFSSRVQSSDRQIRDSEESTTPKERERLYASQRAPPSAYTVSNEGSLGGMRREGSVRVSFSRSRDMDVDEFGMNRSSQVQSQSQSSQSRQRAYSSESDDRSITPPADASRRLAMEQMSGGRGRRISISINEPDDSPTKPREPLRTRSVAGTLGRQRNNIQRNSTEIIERTVAAARKSPVRTRGALPSEFRSNTEGKRASWDSKRFSLDGKRTYSRGLLSPEIPRRDSGGPASGSRAATVRETSRRSHSRWASEDSPGDDNDNGNTRPRYERRGGSIESPIIPGGRSVVGESLKAAGISTRRETNESMNRSTNNRDSVDWEVEQLRNGIARVGVGDNRIHEEEDEDEEEEEEETTPGRRPNGRPVQTIITSRPGTSNEGYLEDAPHTAPPALRQYRSNTGLMTPSNSGTVRERGATPVTPAALVSVASTEHIRLMLESFAMFESNLARLEASNPGGGVSEVLQNADVVVQATQSLNRMLRESAARALSEQIESEVEDRDSREVEIWKAAGAEFRDAVKVSDELTSMSLIREQRRDSPHDVNPLRQSTSRRFLPQTTSPAAGPGDGDMSFGTDSYETPSPATRHLPHHSEHHRERLLSVPPALSAIPSESLVPQVSKAPAMTRRPRISVGTVRVSAPFPTPTAPASTHLSTATATGNGSPEKRSVSYTVSRSGGVAAMVGLQHQHHARKRTISAADPLDLEYASPTDDIDEGSPTQRIPTRNPRASVEFSLDEGTRLPSTILTMPPRRSARNAKPAEEVEETTTNTGAKKRDHSPEQPPAAKKSRSTAKGKKAETKDAEPKPEVKVEDNEASTSEVKPVVRRRAGTTPVDPFSGYESTHIVYCDPTDGEIFAALLNQTNLDGSNNNNKFYVLQLLHPKSDPANIILFTRWGRVGEKGASQEKGPFPAKQAIQEFKKQFKGKAGANWEDRKTMVPKKGKYTWLERDFEAEVGSDDEKQEDSDVKKEEAAEEDNEPEGPPPECTLHELVQDACRLIFNKDVMNAHLLAMKYDANKLPLGKMSKTTILNGFTALKRLSQVIDNPNGDLAKELGGYGKACAELSGRYYSVIPHDFGRSKPFIINNNDTLKRELELVDSLGDMSLTASLMAPKKNIKATHELDAQLASLDLASIDVVDSNSSEFAAVLKYSQETYNGIGSCYSNGGHAQRGANIHALFRVERRGEQERWLSGGWDKVDDGQRLLLWHGSRSTNFAGILKQGLRIAPPEAPVTGYEFGKGVYFGDMLAISANYTHCYQSAGMGLLLLCETVTKPYHEEYGFNFHADKTSKENGKVATKAMGKLQHPDWKDAGEALGRPEMAGVMMPGGKAEDVSSTFPKPSVKVEDNWNEYIVYDVAQIRTRYLLMVQFT
ncbi:poly(ADP)-ribose polymerase PARP protein, putative [Rhizoctonia solani AG-3 Rhs1AP]|uniref:Poly [ADP-ribose] polymerase n=1 Tax=Rhizoctonia solani AG-3 Rhs1AP TaxID=1086054 RepID=X8JTT8_9AGAM|nr:poly(ADP)-ribose polymerase PARP protein, putative [Rhizoctonia solani AG-3 Rhs1AP]